MQAVLEICGKQFCVRAGDYIFVDAFLGTPGEVLSDKFSFLCIFDEKMSCTLLDGKETAGTLMVLDHLKGKKVRVFKMKRRKNYRRLYGHRQPLSKILIQKLPSV